MRRLFGSGLEAVDEPGLDSGADVQERKRIDRRIQFHRQPRRILVRLQLDAGQGVSDGLRFDNADSLPVDEQHVVGEPVAGRHPELAHGNPKSGGEIHLVAVLDDPARLGERRVDLLASLLFRRQRHAHLSGRQFPLSS